MVSSTDWWRFWIIEHSSAPSDCHGYRHSGVSVCSRSDAEAAEALASHCGAARFAFNWGLALVKDRMDARQAGDEAGFHGHCHDCVESGISQNRTAHLGGRRTPRRPILPVWIVSPEHSRITGTVLTDDERDRGSGFPASRNEVAHRTPAASPRAQFGWSQTGTTLRCLDSARSEPTNPRESSLVVLSSALLASVPPPSRDEPTVGLPRSVELQREVPATTARPPLSESTLEYDIWR